MELISIRDDGTSRVEHYGKDYEETYNLGLVKNHYFINDTTNVTSYCLEHYEEIKNEKLCNNICRKKVKITKETTQVIVTLKHFNYSKY